MLNLYSAASQTIKLDADLQTAQNLFSQSIEKIGTLKNTEYVENGVVLKAKSRYGLQRVSLDVHITSTSDKTTEAVISGKVMDVDGAAVPKCIQRLIETVYAYHQNNEEQIQELEEMPAFKRKTGFKLGTLLLIVAAFVVVLFLMNSGSTSPSYYGKYRPTSDNPNPVMKDVIERQDVYIELDKSGLIFYHATMSGYPTIENKGNYTVKDGEIHIEWANGKLPDILYLEKSGGTYTISLSGNVYKKEAD